MNLRLSQIPKHSSNDSSNESRLLNASKFELQFENYNN